MRGRVKRRRPYDSSVRREQALVTRRRILEAAQTRFERDGYASTTVAAIGREADVSIKTVYLAFGTKSGVLRALWHVLLRGDEQPVPVGDRPWFRAVLDEPDPGAKLRLNLKNATVVRKRVGRLLEVLRDAAPTDTEIAELWQTIQGEFYDNQRAVVQDLHRRKALRRGLVVGRASDILWTLNHPDVYRLLVTDRGWSPEEYEEWAAALLSSQLLRTD